MVRIAEFPDKISTILPITYYDLQGPSMSESTRVKIVKDKAKIKKLFDVLALLQDYKESRTVTKRPEGNILLTFLLNDGSQINYLFSYIEFTSVQVFITKPEVQANSTRMDIEYLQIRLENKYHEVELLKNLVL